MKFWGKRKKSRPSKSTSLSMEKLEGREMMAVIPIISGQATTFQDADGTQVTIKLTGPGEGSLELVNGVLTGAAIDSLILNGTTGATKLKIKASGGAVSGTTINELIISKALNELGALKSLKAAKLDFVDDGFFSANGNVETMHVGSFGDGTKVEVAGNLGKLKAESLQENATIDVAGSLRKFVTQLLNTGSQVSAGQIEMLKVKDYANGTTVDVGAGGLAKAKIGNIYNSQVSSAGGVGEFLVKGATLATQLASNMNAGSDRVFGTIDDFVNDPNHTGNINSVKLRGMVGAQDSNQKVSIVTSGRVGEVQFRQSAQQLGATPQIWIEAASQSIPITIATSALNANGFANDEIWIAIFGEEIATPGPGDTPPPAQNYYLDATQIVNGAPVLQTTQPLVPTSGTPNLPIVPSFTLADWGSNLAFPVPMAGYEFTGRILISVGAPVQAQVNQDTYHSVSAPSASNPIDPSTGTFYDFLEFTVTGNASGGPSLDIDTSQVDSFGLPIELQFFQDAAGTMEYTIPFSGTTNGTNVISGVTNVSTLVGDGLGTGQPVTGPGIPPGATVHAYDILHNTITLTKVTGTNSQLTQFTAYPAGPVGVQAERDAIMNGTTPDALLQFIQNQLAAGSESARPFLQSAAPYQTSEPTPVTGVVISPATITTPSIGSLQANEVVTITGLVGTTSLNGNFVVDVVDSGSFTLGGPTGSGTYTNGTGTWSANGSTPLAISGATNVSTAAIVLTTSSTAGVAQGDVVTISGVQGNTAANGTFLVAGTTPTTITLGSPVGTQTYTSGGAWFPAATAGTPITSVTAGNPNSIQTSTTGLSNGNTVFISGVTGVTDTNGVFTIAGVSGTGFTLNGTNGTGTWVSGGDWWLATPITGATDGGEVIVSTDSTTGMANGDMIAISGVVGTTVANGVLEVANVTPTSFSLVGVTGNAAYESGGTWTMAINGTSTTSAVVTTGSTTGLANGGQVTVAGVGGNTAVNGTFIASNVSGTQFTLAGPVGNGAYQANTGGWSLPNVSTIPITGASNSSSIVITTPNITGLLDGDYVYIEGVQGNTAANGVFEVSAATATSFTLANSTGNGAYTQGGTWQLVQPITNATNDGNPIEITVASTAGLSQGMVVEVQGVEGNTAANGQWVIASLTGTSFTLGSPAGTGAYTSGGTWSTGGPTTAITGATNGGLIVISAGSTTGLANGDLVEVSGVLGNTAANGFFFVTDVTGTSFTLQGSASGNTYTSGGTWNEYSQISRLVSPKDITESLLIPQDPNALNNYYNQVIDDFFLQYLPATEQIGNQYGGDQTFQVYSWAGGTPYLYSGTVTNGTTDNPTANGGYVLRLTSSNPQDTTTYDIYYPFFTENAPSPDIYTPLFPLAAAPSWITANSQQNQSASQMIFACDALFADNVERIGIGGITSATAPILGDLENSISAAFNRGIALNPTDTWSNSATWFPDTGTYNYWVEFWHQTGLMFGNLAYAFPYDDKWGASTNLNITNPGLAEITLGGWSATAASTDIAFQSPPANAAPGSQITLSAQVTGTASPTGTVAFFINGAPLNSNNYSASPPMQPMPINGSGIASITANLPSLPDGTDPHTYTVTAIYSGDTNNLPSIASHSLLQEDPISLALIPGGGPLGTMSEMQVTLPGTTYDGTIDFTISLQDGSGSMSLGSVDVNAGTLVNTNMVEGTFPVLTSTFTGYTAGSIATPSNVITDISYTAPLVPNTQTISGTGIPVGASISTFTPATLTLSANAIGSGAVTITAGPVTITGTTIAGTDTVNVTGVAGWTQGASIDGTAVAGANFAAMTTIANFTAASATMNNSTTTTATSPVSISSVANLLNFTGYYDPSDPTGQTITGLSTVSNIVPGQTIISGGGLAAGSMMTGFTPVNLLLNNNAAQSGTVVLSVNNVTIYGTLTQGSNSVNVTTVEGWTPTTTLEGKSITVTSGTGQLAANSKVGTFQSASAVFDNALTNTTTAITFTSAAQGSALPITATWTPTNGSGVSSSELFGVT